MYMPMLIIRTRYGAVAVELNGALVGEASPASHVAVPLSETGEYYLGIYPLRSEEGRYFPVMRKLCFVQGVLQPLESDDVEAYAWPDGIYEVIVAPGVLPAPRLPVFSFMVDQLQLRDGSTATLYYEDGLRLAVEQNGRVKYGAVLGEYRTGKLQLGASGQLFALAGEPSMQSAYAPEGYASTVLALSGGFKELLHVQAQAAGLREEAVVCFGCLPTLHAHDEKQVYTFADGEYTSQPPQIGFFTHAPLVLEGQAMVMRAFCEAVQYRLFEEAFTYLSPALREGLDEGTLKEFLGACIKTRPPFFRRDRMIGLVYGEEGGIHAVRLLLFTFEEGKIDNMEDA